MLIRIRADLAFALTNRTQAEALRDYLIPLISHAINMNEGASNQEISYIIAEKCYHDELPSKPCEIVGKWEVGRGRVI